ncbi:hypothetical protein ES708_32664 [subsurface metagenome]
MNNSPIVKNYFLILLLSGSFFTLSLSQCITERDKILRSTIIGKEINYSILLPENYYSNSDSFSVIYLLHGFGGNHNSWLIRCKIDNLVDSLKNHSNIRDFIFVMPDARNSYYINNYDSSYRVGDFLIQELIPAIDSLYRTRPNKEHRAIMGLSMGGFGAIINAIKNYDLFGSVLALSAAVRTESIFKSLPQERYEKYLYGPGLADTVRITNHWKENSPYYLIDTTLAKSLSGINWYIDCGLDDFLLPANEAFHQLLLKRNIPHEYHVRPGKHNWQYWYKSSVNGLLYLNEKLTD